MIKVEIDKSIKCNGDYSLFVSFDYDTKVVDTIRELPTRYWSPDSKEWEIPFNRLGELVNKLPDYDFDISGTYVALEKPKADVPKNFKFKTQPYEYQIEGFNFGIQNDCWLLGDEMGLGKTKQVIDIAVAKKLQYGYEHCLIICGVNGLKWNWQIEVSKHSNERAWILGQRRVGTKIKIGGNKEKRDDLSNLDKLSDYYFIIVNIEALRDVEIVERLSKMCSDKTIGLIAFDECHKAKNPTSQQGKGVLKLQAENMIAMTGTPLMNTPLDLYIILKWLGYEKHSFYQFKNHYCVMGGYGGYQVVAYRNLSELQDELSGIMLRRLKDEVLDLPEKIYIDEYVDMTPKQETIYNEVTADIKANIDQIKMASNPLAELIRMRQATGYTGILSSSIKESAKLDRLEELVEEAVCNDRKVVIFSNWTQMTGVIRTRLTKKYKGVVITGQTADAERQVNVNHFQNNPECKYIIGTSGAMGTGLTLTAGTVVIFLDEPWNKALKEQCVDRCHRVGTNSKVTIYTLMAKGTIDERIHELVERKGQMANALVDGKISASAREVLEYLIG